MYTFSIFSTHFQAAFPVFIASFLLQSIFLLASQEDLMQICCCRRGWL